MVEQKKGYLLIEYNVSIVILSKFSKDKFYVWMSYIKYSMQFCINYTVLLF